MAEENPPQEQGASSATLSRSLRSRQNSQPVIVRRQSTQERINEILETGRGRAGMMSGSWTPRRPSLHHALHSSEPGDGADEQTGIFMRGNARNYQGTAIAESQRVSPHSSPRPARSRVPTGNSGITRDVGGHVEEKHTWKEYFSTLWSVELENKGSVARDHLALERTFLAWLRTSLAFASIGIAVTQLFRLNTSLADDGEDDPAFTTIRRMGKPLGASFLGISILVLLLGYQRYFTSQRWIMKGKFPASRGTIIVVSLIALALMVVSLIVVLVIQPTNTRDDL